MAIKQSILAVLLHHPVTTIGHQHGTPRSDGPIAPKILDSLCMDIDGLLYQIEDQQAKRGFNFFHYVFHFGSSSQTDHMPDNVRHMGR